MRINYSCVECQMQRHFIKAAEINDEQARLEYIMTVMRIMTECGDAPAPVCASMCRPVEDRFLGMTARYAAIKRKYNDLMLGMEARFAERIDSSDDPLRTAMLFARAGNYIDFGTEKQFCEPMLFELLERVENERLDDELYARFVGDMDRATNVLYITDNCGEIVMDKLLIDRMKTMWPKAHITVMVRGSEILNDATREDAEQVGLTASVEVIDSGTDIPGAWLPKMSEKAREYTERADVIISKGQANAECLMGCGLNIYYLLLCKCERFVSMFGVERYTGLFINEKDIGRGNDGDYRKEG